MANRIQNGYRSYMQDTSPDMDMLWKRIEQKIDEKQPPQIQQQTIIQTQQPNITVKKTGFLKYAAIAACFIAVVAGTVIFLNAKDNSVSMDSTNSKTEYKAAVDSTIDKPEQLDIYERDAKTADNNSDTQYNNRSVVNNRDTIDSIPQKKTDAVSTASKEKIKKLMESEQYTSADMQGRIDMIEKLAKELKDNGEITEYNMVIKDSLSRIEITLPDGTIQGIMIK